MNRNLDATLFAVTERFSWPRLSRLCRGQLFRQLRIERIAKAVLRLLKFEDLAAIASGVVPPAVGQQFVAMWYHLAQYLSYINTYISDDHDITLSL